MPDQFPLAYAVGTPECRSNKMLAYSGDFELSLDHLSELGYDGVELMTRNPDEFDVDVLAHSVKQRGLQVCVIGTGQVTEEDGLTLTSTDTSVREASTERLVAIIDFAARFGALVNVGRVRGNLTAGQEESQRGWAKDLLREVADYARRSDVRLVLEPQNRHVSNLNNSVSETLSFLEELGAPNVGVMADTFHMNIEEASLEASLVQARELLWHVHFAENNRLSPGGGSIKFLSLLQTLRALDYSGWISMEHLQRPNSREAARSSIEYTRLLERRLG